MAQPTLDGTAVRIPTDGGLARQDVGVTQLVRARNGAARLFAVAAKWSWRVEIDYSAKPSLNLGISHTFVDEAGTSYTVLIEPGSYEERIVGEDGGSPRYTVALTLQQV